MSEELEVQTTTQVDVMIALARMEGQLSSFISLMTTQGDALTQLTGEVSKLRDRVTVLEPVAIVPGEVSTLRERVTTLEATRSATPQWWTVLGVLVPTLGFLWIIAERLFGK